MTQVTSPDNIPSPDLTDQYALTQDMANLADGTQKALIKRANFYLGTSAQRTAFTTAPEGTHWQDTNGTKFEYVRQSGQWVNKMPDTGWNTLTLSTGNTGSLRWRCVGVLVEVRWAGAGNYPVGATSITSGSIPPAYRPSESIRGTGSLNGNAGALLYATPGGAVGVINSTGASRTAGEGQCFYFI